MNAAEVRLWDESVLTNFKELPNFELGQSAKYHECSVTATHCRTAGDLTQTRTQ